MSNEGGASYSAGWVKVWTVEIICTDRGQHKRTWMTRMICDESPEGILAWRSFILGSEPKHSMYGPPLKDAEPGEPTSRESYGFACSRCPRWPKIDRRRWVAVMTEARRVGTAEFDVSYLD